MGCVGVIIAPEWWVNSQEKRERPAQSQVFLLPTSPVRCLQGEAFSAAHAEQTPAATHCYFDKEDLLQKGGSTHHHDSALHNRTSAFSIRLPKHATYID